MLQRQSFTVLVPITGLQTIHASTGGSKGSLSLY
jgi:hypothetical protein